MSTTEYLAKDGNTYIIAVDDEGSTISVMLNDVELGKIILDWHEADVDNDPYYYHITHLALDCCAGLGLGRACLVFHKECFDAPITAGSDSGEKAEDGSHLTGAGAGFISRMRDEGLVVSRRGNLDRYDVHDD